MNSNLTKKNRELLEQILEYLDTRRPGFRGSEVIFKALSGSDVDLYLRSWIFPKIETMLRGPRRRAKRGDFGSTIKTGRATP